MTKTTKRILIAAAVLIILGLGLCLLAYTLAGSDLAQLSTADTVGRTQTISEPFDSLSIDLASHTVRLLPSEDGICQVVWRERPECPLAVAVRDGVLRITQPGSYSAFFFGFFWGEPEFSLTVYLPGEQYEVLTVNTTSGDVEVPVDFRFRTVRLVSTSGNLVCLAQTEDSLFMNSTSGNLDLAGVSPARAELDATSGEITARSCQFPSLDASTVSGDIRLEDCQGGALSLSATSGGLFLTRTAFSGEATLETASGDVVLEDFDAAGLHISAVSGSVTGALCSGKLFQAETTSGSIHLPPDSGPGRCDIETVSGDIDLKISGK